ncbi:MOSC domain-containing protein [Candidatus Parcubacteria bacterium]|nr:MAG: MOSC domain-containing protein [Candidatus Parcubacteria bacterium]
MSTPRLISIQVGRPRQLGIEGAPDPMDRPWVTSFFKDPVDGPVWLGLTNLAGDGQADRENHGGPDKAVLAYAAAHYPLWRSELGRPDLPFGAFAENFTIEGLTEASVCIGDVYAIGDVRVQVSQPRQPCWKIARRWRIKDLTARVRETGRTGWYLRVLAEGYVEPGLPVTLIERPYPQWTVARATEIMHRRRESTPG